jgi:chromosome segregation ATPase
MTAAPFDTLKLTKALREKAHFTQEQAEGLTEALSDSFEEQIATKQDIAGLRADLKGDIAGLKHEIDHLDAKLTAKFDHLDAKYTASVDQLDAKFTAKFDQLDEKFEPLELRLTVKLGAIVAAIVSVAMLFIKFAHI